MITIVLYLIWRFILDEDDDFVPIIALFGILDGLLLWGFLASILHI